MKMRLLFFLHLLIYRGENHPTFLSNVLKPGASPCISEKVLVLEESGEQVGEGPEVNRRSLTVEVEVEFV